MYCFETLRKNTKKQGISFVFRQLVLDIRFNASTEIVRHIFTTATFRNNYLKKCTLDSDKELKKEWRGSYDYRTDVNSELHFVK